MASLNLLTNSWSHSTGSSTSGVDKGLKTMYDSSGNVYYCGTIRTATLSFYGFITKLSSTGTVSWTKSIFPSGTTNNINIQGLTIDKNDNIYIIGSTNSATILYEGISYTSGTGTNYDLFLLKINTSGAYLILNRITSASDDNFYQIISDNNNDLCLSGQTKANMTYVNNIVGSTPSTSINVSGTVKYSGFIIKLDKTTLNVIWSNLIAYNLNNDYFPTGLTNDVSNNIYVSYYSSSAGEQLSLLKYASTGSLTTSISLGTVDSRNIYLTSDIQSNIYVSNEYYNVSRYDVQIRKYNSALSLITSRTLNGNTNVNGNHTSLSGITSDRNQNIYVYGDVSTVTSLSIDGTTYTRTQTLDADFYLLKVDKNLNLIYLEIQRSSGSVADYAYDVKVDNNFNLYITGWTNPNPSTITIANSNITLSENAFLIRLTQRDPMILKYTNVANSTIQLGIIGITNCVVDWGDGTIQTISSQLPTRTYGAGITNVTIKITGSFTTYGPGQSVLTNASKLSECVSFGSIPLTSITGAFRYATNLTSVPATIPSTVTNLNFVFDGASNFNSDISLWDTSNVTGMFATFYGASKFNSPINTNGVYWNTSKVTTMFEMFYGCSLFNQDISLWDVSKVTTMAGMFANAVAFNQPIGRWNTSSLTNIGNMFFYATSFNQCLSNWNTSSVTNMGGFLDGAGAFQNYTNNIGSLNFGMGSNSGNGYSFDNNNGISVPNTNVGGVGDFDLPGDFTIEWWQFKPLGGNATCFWIPSTETYNPLPPPLIGVVINVYYNLLLFIGSISLQLPPISEAVYLKWMHIAVVRSSNVIRIYINGTQFGSTMTNSTSISSINITPLPLLIGNRPDGYNYGFNGHITNFRWVSGTALYTSNFTPLVNPLINISGTKCLLLASTISNYLTDTAAPSKTITIYGTVVWSNSSPYSLDNWNTSSVTGMNLLFANTQFNQYISSWNTGNVTNMLHMFSGNSVFNQDISSWNVSKVTNMSFMFANAYAFNQSLSNWNTSLVTNMERMFSNASTFNQYLNYWNVSSVVNMANMFNSASQFGNITNGGSLTFASPSNSSNPCCLTTSSASGTTDLYFGIHDFTIEWWQNMTSSVVSRIIQFGIWDEDHSFSISVEGSNNTIYVWVSANGGSNIQTGLSFPYSYESYRNKWTHIAVVRSRGILKLYANGVQHPNTYNISAYNIYSNANRSVIIGSYTNLPNKPYTSVTQFIGNLTNLRLVNGTAVYSNNFNPSYPLQNIPNTRLLLLSNNQSNMILDSAVGRSITNINNVVWNSSVPFTANTWNVSSVQNMSYMFFNASLFNQNISKWLTNSATNMSYMFSGASSFNQNIIRWNTTTVTNMSNMFNNATLFNQNLSHWNISNVTNITDMLRNTALNIINYSKILIRWSALTVRPSLILNVSPKYYLTVDSFRTILTSSPNNWTITDGGVETLNSPLIMSYVNITSGTTIKLPIQGITSGTIDWDDNTTSTISTLTNNPSTGDGIGTYAIGTYSIVTIMTFGSFNSLSSFVDNSVISGATKLTRIIDYGAFINSISNMNNAFYGCSSLLNIPSPLPPLVTSLQGTFKNASVFNQNISNWGPGIVNVTNLNNTFENAFQFNQNLSNWNVINVLSASNMFDNSGLSTTNYTNLLIGWANLGVSLKSNVIFGALSIKYFTSAIASKLYLTGTKTWNITDNGILYQPAQLEYINMVNNITIQLPIKNTIGTVVINWGDGLVDTLSTSVSYPSHTYSIVSSSTIVVTILGTFNSFSCYNTNTLNAVINVSKFSRILDWGDSSVSLTSMEYGFYNATAFTSIVSLPSTVTNASRMFQGATLFNQDISGWDITNLTNTSYMFNGATNFNQNLTSWNFANVSNMTGMFQGATTFNNGTNANMNISTFRTSGSVLMDSMFQGAVAFNRNITQWNTSAVSSMSNMFNGASLFNQNINTSGIYWNVSNVVNMISMFQGASAFNQNLNNWDISGINPASSGNMTNIFTNSGLSYLNLTYILIGWGAKSNLKSNVILGANNIYYYSEASSAVSTLQSYNWTINSSGVYGPIPIPMVLTYNAINIGNVIQLPIKNYTPGLNITIDWGDGTALETTITQNPSHTYQINLSNVTTTITIYFLNHNAFTKFGLNSSTEVISNISKLTGVVSFGNLQLNSLESAFFNATSLRLVPSSLPLTVLTLKNTFNGANVFNQDISGWNISNITDLTGTFNNALLFNQNLATWNIAKVGLNGGNMINLFVGSKLSEINYTNILIGWANRIPNIQTSITLGANNINYYSEANTSKTLLENPITYNWTINDGNEIGISPTPIVLTYVNITNGTIITLPIKNIIYDIDINWGDGTITRSTQALPNLSRTYDGSVNNPTITITPIRTISFNKFGITDLNEIVSGINKLSSVISFGNTELISLEGAFYNATSLISVPLSLPSTITTLKNTFNGATNFDQSLNNWDTTNVTTMSGMFNGASSFNSSISNWITTYVTDFSLMFKNASLFNKNINTNISSGYWITSSAQFMNSMFENASAYELSLNNWNVSSVSTMELMFKNASSFNGLITNWDVINVSNMSSMFEGASLFNQNINTNGLYWRTSALSNTSSMFKNASQFNQDISGWNTSLVINMASMFQSAIIFNKNISSWNVSNVANMSSMFQSASNFNQDLKSWNVINLTNASLMFNNSGLSVLYYTLILRNWRNLDSLLQSNVLLGASTIQYYPSANLSKYYLTSIKTWVINDAGILSSEPLQLEYINITNGTIIELPIKNITSGSLTINWGNNIITTNSSNFPSHQYTSSFTNLIITVSGTFTTITSVKSISPSIVVVSGNNRLKYVYSYGSNSVNITDMSYGFYGCSSLIEVPVIPASVLNSSYMFYNASLFNYDISNWGTTNITNMSYMFYGAQAFNQDISLWDVSNVQNMSGMFQNASIFNKSLGSWNTSAVLTMDNMFYNSNLTSLVLNNGSISFNGTSNYLEVLNDGNLSLGTDNFTIEWWQYKTTTKSSERVFWFGPAIVPVITFTIDNLYNTNLYINGGSGNNYNNFGTLTSASIMNTWVHIAIVRSSGTIKLFINGTQFGNSWFYNTITNSSLNNTNTSLHIGYQPSGSSNNFIGGNITNFRWLRGSALYDSNFTNPNRPLSIHSNSIIYLPVLTSATFLNNLSSVSKLIRNNGSTWSILKPFGNNLNLSIWNTSNVTTMNNMFRSLSNFNQNISTWNVGNVVNMSSMFESASNFNQNLSSWNVAKVTDMSSMFKSASQYNNSGNNLLSQWQPTLVETTANMFYNAFAFNINISSWVFTVLSNIDSMFYGSSTFNQNIGSWYIVNVNTIGPIFINSGLSNDNYSNILIGWASYQNLLQPNLTLDARPRYYYSSAIASRDYLVNIKNWTIQDNGFLAIPTSFQYINVLSNTEIRLPIKNINLSVVINWGDGIIETVLAGINYPYHQYSSSFSASPITVTITVLGGYGILSSFDGSSVIPGTNKLYKILTYADSAPYITNCEYAFYGATSLIEVPTLPSGVTNTAHMFHGASSFNQNISGWSTSNVSDMSSMFEGATSFNSNINTNGIYWNVGSVQNMSSMFKNATNFNSSLSNWTTLSLNNADNMFYEALSFNKNITNFNMSNVVSSSYMFYNAVEFNNGELGNFNNFSLSSWNTEKITDMSHMFEGCAKFNQSLANWSVSKVLTMESMFKNAILFNQNLSLWLPTLTISMKGMFEGASKFNQSLISWGSSMTNLTTIEAMFKNASLFNGDISTWNTQTITNMSSTFSGAVKFNQNISNWNTSSVINMSNMFNGATDFTNTNISLNTNSNYWNVSFVQNMSGMFKNAINFNQGVTNWNTSAVLDMSNMFFNARVFNQDISNWNTSLVVDMSDMFNGALLFNQNINTNTSLGISRWNVSLVENMARMFKNAGEFDKSLTNWNVSSVENMESMFEGASVFNKNITSWNVSNVSNMSLMFNNATLFNQNLGSWNVTNVLSMNNMLLNSGLSSYNYSSILIQWALLNVKENISFSVGNIKYFQSAQTSKNILINPLTKKWIITDGGSITTPIQFKYINITAGTTIQVPIQIFTGSLIINWGDNTTAPLYFSPFPSHTYLNDYDLVIITVLGDISHISTFDPTPLVLSVITGTNKLEKVFSYGDNQNQLDNFDYAFYQATSLNELPDLPLSATTLKNMLNGATSFDQDMSDWNITNVSSMENMLTNTGLSNLNYSLTLIGWVNNWTTPPLTLQSQVLLNASNYYYPTAITARAYLTNPTGLNWTINDLGIENIPIVYDLNYTTYMNNSREIILKATDLDIGQTLVYEIVTFPDPQKGTLSPITMTNKITYTPNPSFSGFDLFTYRVFDGIDYSSSGTVNITIRTTQQQYISVRTNVINETNQVFGNNVVPIQLIDNKIVLDIIQLNANQPIENNLSIYLSLINTYKFGATISFVDGLTTYSIVLNTIQKKDAIHRCIRKELIANNLNNFKIVLTSDKQLLNNSLIEKAIGTNLFTKDINIFITDPYATLTESIDISLIDLSNETIFFDLYVNEQLKIYNGPVNKTITMNYYGLNTSPTRYFSNSGTNFYLTSRFMIGNKDLNIIGLGSVYLGSELEFNGGNGTQNNPYQISSWNQLSNIRNYLNPGLYFIITQNLSNLNLGYASNIKTPNGLANNNQGWLPIGDQNNSFLGVLNGNNKTLNYLEINRTSSYIGLFGNTGEPSLVKNLGILNAVISGYDNVGCIAGKNNVGSIEGCYMNLVSSITGHDYVGGLVGYNNLSKIEKSYSTGTINGASYVGGLTGFNDGGNIINSYSISNVFGTSLIGGLIGKNLNANVTYCYSAGVVKLIQIGGNNVGGLIGMNSNTTLYTITGSIWDSETSMQRTSSGGVAGTRIGMKIKETFTNLGWNFSSIWYILEEPSNGAYPVLITPQQYPYPGYEGLGSVFLNGSLNSYISVENNNTLSINGDEEFTIEWFQYQTYSNIRTTIFAIGSENSLLSLGVSFVESGISINQKRFKLWLNGTAYSIGEPLNISDYTNQWIHFAIVRSSVNVNNLITVYMQGAVLGTLSYSNPIDNGISNGNLIIGNQSVLSSECSFSGYITNFRFVKGYPVYINTYLQITKPLGNINGTLLLLLTSDSSNSLTDSSSNPLIITSANYTWSTRTPFEFNETPGPAPAPEPEPSPETEPEPEPPINDFELEYLVQNNGTITLPLRGTVNVRVYWHDGTQSYYNTPGDKNHTYLTGGTYFVRIYGTLTQFGADSNTYANADKLIRVNSFGNLGLTSLAGAFRDAVNLVGLPTELPSTIINLKYLLYGATSFNDPNITLWYTGNVENMSYMLFQATAFDQDIYGWNISKVKNRKFIFYGCNAYQKDIDGWFLDKVLNLAVRI